MSRDRPAIDNAYRRGVNADGNPVARQLVEQVFEPCDTTWRGLGSIAASGLAIRPEFSRFDASMRFDVPIEPTVEPRGCRCGDVLRGAITPSNCPLFRPHLYARAPRRPLHGELRGQLRGVLPLPRLIGSTVLTNGGPSTLRLHPYNSTHDWSFRYVP
ncbi:MAG: hypothetical protein V8Q95_05260 [Collinsella sp.]